MYGLPVNLILQSLAETLYMVFVSGCLSLLLGLPLGVLLMATQPGQILQNRGLQLMLNFLVNITRAIPFIILLIVVLPLTRILVGSSIGVNAAIVPLTLGAIPFVARIVENNLAETAASLTETGQAMGASVWQIIYKIWLPNAQAGITQGVTVVWISLVGYSAMAGAVGGGGLGSLAINYGYQRFNFPVLLITVILLIITVYSLQIIGDKIARIISH